MNDLTKMEQDFAQKLKIARLENEEMARNGGIHLHIELETYRKNGKIGLHFGDIMKGLPVRTVHDILNAYPCTDDIKVYVGHSQYEMLPYDMYVLNGPNERDRLSITYISGEYEVSLYMHIDMSDPDVSQFFSPTTRKLSDSEFSTYYKVRTRWNRNAIDYFRYLTFSCGRIVRFQGGHDKQVAPGILTAIAENFKWKTFDE